MSGLTRRDFSKTVAVTTLVVGTAGFTGLGLVLNGSGTHAFELEHDESVKVWFGNGERFEMKIIDRSNGEVLQHETDLDLAALLDMESDYVSVRRVSPPGS